MNEQQEQEQEEDKMMLDDINEFLDIMNKDEVYSSLLQRNILNEYHRRQLSNLFTNKDFIIADEKEREKMVEKFNTDFVNFVKSLQDKEPEAVKKFNFELDGFKTRSIEVGKISTDFILAIEDLVKERNFQKIRVMVFKLKKQLLKRIKKNNYVDYCHEINLEDFYGILKIIKDTYKIDYFWTRIKR